MSRPERPRTARLSTGPKDRNAAIVVSPHHLASQAGLDILAHGGNAVDAAITVNAVLGVVAPDTCGPGGDLFALVHEPGETVPAALNASGRAGSGVSSDDMRNAGHGEIPARSPWSITVPGCVDGWESLVERYGNLPLSKSLEPAITLARDGFVVAAELATSLEAIADLIGSQASSASMYPGGIPAAAGSHITRTDLAETLSAVSSGGRDAFYSGDVGKQIAATSDGAITPDDLSRVQSEWVEAASLECFGKTGWTFGPNSQGYITLATLWIFEHLDPPDDANDPLFHHLLIEAYRSVAWERDMYVSDAGTAPLTDSQLLGGDRLSERAASIDRSRAGRWPTPAPAPSGTAFMAVKDSNGMGVSLIQSNFMGIGSGISAGATGVFLHNRGAGFNLIPGHPNEYTPGRRPQHTLAPTLWTAGNSLDLLLGTRGGHRQPQFLCQYAASHYAAGLCTDDSQMVPRWNIQEDRPGTDSAIEIEPRFNSRTVSSLESMGHLVTNANPWEPGWGPVSAIDVGGEMKGSADPRVSTSAALTGR